MANQRIQYVVGVKADTTEFRQQVSEAITSLQRLGISPNVTPELKAAGQAALELSINLQRAFDQNTGKLDLTTFNNELNRSGKDLKAYYQELVNLGPEGEKAFTKIADAIVATEMPLRRSSKLLDELWVTMKNTMRWQITSGTLNAFTGALNTAYGYSKDLNRSLNSIRVITNKNVDAMRDFTKEANNAAKALSTTTVDYTDASLIYYQQGLNDQQVQERTDATIKLANVSRQSAEEVSSQMTAIWQNFYNGSKSLEYYIDVITALGATTASSSDQIATGLQKFAPIANTVGLSYEYAAAALATLVANTQQSADMVGTSLRTLFSRLQSLKLGETLDDGTDLNKYSEALYKVGINIKDINGELKDMDTILNESFAKWDSLNKAQQMALAQTVGGVRQYTSFIALMEGQADFQENLNTALGSEGTLEKQAQVYAESWEAARTRVKAASEDIYNSLINPEFYIGVDNTITPILSRVADIIDGLGGLKGVLSGISSLMLLAFGKQIAVSMQKMYENISLMTGQESKRIQLLRQQAVEITNELHIGEENTRLGAEKLRLLQAERDYHQKIHSVLDFMTESEREEAKVITSIVDKKREEYDLTYKTAQLAKEKVQAKAEQFIGTSINYIPTLRNQQGEIITGKGKQTEAIQQILQGINIQVPKSYNYANSLNFGFDQLLEKITQVGTNFNSLKSIQQRYASGTLQNKQAVLDYAKSLGLTNEQLDILNKQTYPSQIKKILNDQISSTKIDLNNLSEVFTQLFGIKDKEVQEYIRLLNESANAEENTVQQTDALLAWQKKVLEFLDNLKNQQKSWSQQFTHTAQLMSQASFIGSSLTSFVNTLVDQENDGVDKFTSSLASLSAIIPGIIFLFKSLNTAIAGTSGLMKAVPYFGILLALLPTVINLISQIIPTAKKAREEVNKLFDDLDEEHHKLDEINNQLKETQDRLEELNNIEHPTLADLEEIKKLKEQNNLLEAQKKLQEDTIKVQTKQALQIYAAQAHTVLATTEFAPMTTVKGNNREAFLATQQQLDYAGLNITQDQLGLPGADEITVSLEDRIKELQVLGETASTEQKKNLADLQNQLALARKDWKDTNQEMIDLANEGVKQYLTALDDGIVSVTEVYDDLVTIQKQVIANNKIIYGQESFDKLFNESAYSNLLANNNFLYQRVRGQQVNFSETEKLDLIRFGTSESEINDWTNRQLDALRRNIKLANDEEVAFIRSLNEEQLYIATQIEMDDGTLPMDYLRTLDDALQKKRTLELDIKLSKSGESLRDSLTKIYNGEFLNDEDIANLKANLSGIYDLDNFENYSMLEQSRILTEAYSFVEKTSGKTLALSQRIIDIQREIAVNEGNPFFDDTIAKQEIADIQEQLDNIKLTSYVDLVARFDDSSFYGLLGELGTLRKAIGYLDDDFVIAADDLEDLVNTMPGLLREATVNADGTVQLNQQVVNNIIEQEKQITGATQAELSTQLDNFIIEKNDELDALEQMRLLKKQIEEKGTIDQDIELQIQEANHTDAVRSIIVGRIKQRIESAKQSTLTRLEEVDAYNQTAQAGASSAQQIADKYQIAFENIANNAYKAFSAVQDYMAGNIPSDYTTVTEQATGFDTIKYQWQNYDATQSAEIKQLSLVGEGLLAALNGSFTEWTETLHNSDIAVDPDIYANAISQAVTKEFAINIAPENLYDPDKFAEAFYTAVLKSGKNGNELIDTGWGSTEDELGAYIIKRSQLFSLDTVKPGTEPSNKRSEKERERYHKINRLLEQQKDLLDDIDNRNERLYGSLKIDQYTNKQMQLNKQIDLYRDKLDEIERKGGYFDQDLTAMQSALAQAGVASATLDSRNNITNIEEILRSLYNNWDNGFISDEVYDDTLKKIKQFEDTADLIREINDAIRESRIEIDALDLTKIEELLQMQTDRRDIQNNMLEWRKSFAESFSDNVFHGAEIGNITTNQTILEMSQLQGYIDTYNQLVAKWREGNLNTTDFNRIKEDMVNLQEQIIGTGKNILELIDTMENLLPDAVSDAANRFSQFTDQLDKNRSILGTIKDLMELRGVSYRTAAGFRALSNNLQEQMKTQTTASNLYRENLLRYKTELQDAQAQLDALNRQATLEGRDLESYVNYDMLKGNRDALLAEYNANLEGMLNSAKESIETAKQIFSLTIESAKYDFDQAVSEGTGLDLLQDQFDHYIEEEERYFDKVNELYQVNIWNNKLQQDIDNTTNKVYADRLKALQDEIDLRREGGTLSQYDLDILEAKYNLLQAEMALEDAQNAKTNLRLVRDRQGNWNYQYTADQGEIDDAQNDVLKAQNDWYNIAKKQVGNTNKEIIKLYAEMRDAVEDIWTTDGITREEALAKEEEVRRYYAEKIAYLEREKNQAIADMTEAGKIAIDDFSNVYAGDLEKLNGDTEHFTQEMNYYMGQCRDAFDDYKSTVTENTEIISNVLGNETGLTKITNELATSTEQVGNNAVIAIDKMHDKIEEIQSITTAFSDMADQIERVLKDLDKQAGYSTAQGIAMNNGYSNAVDYGAIMAYMMQEEAKTGETAQGWDIITEQRQNKWLERHKQGYTDATTSEILTDLQDETTRKKLIATFGEDTLKRWYEALMRGELPTFDTGGYTGDFNNGRLAILHEKELVLNQQDTDNILTAVSAIRSLGPEFFRSIQSILDNNIAATQKGLGSMFDGTYGQVPQREPIQQSVSIEAHFPNATNHSEIEEAFRNLANDAAQWVDRKY